MCAPAKIKIHNWRAMLGVIPCLGVLANRHVPVSSQCPLCSVHCESIAHAFFKCAHVREIWAGLGMVQLTEDASVLEINDTPILESILLDSATSSLLPEIRRCDLATVVISYIWWERRKATHGESVQEPLRSAQSIMALALNYKRLKKLGARPIDRHGWEKPTEDLVKLNVDAAFDINSGAGGTCVIIRDHFGSFVSGGRWSLQFVEDAATAEACALHDGLLLAGKIGCNKLIVESDCLEVVEIMQNGRNSLGAAAIYEECTFLCHGFACVSFAHCPREANMAAHELAKFNEVNHGVWHGDPPNCIRVVIANDVSIIPNS